MKHDCISKVRADLKKSDPTLGWVRFDLSTIANTDGTGEAMTGQRIEYSYKHKKKDGTEIEKTAKSFVTHNFCPFCGKSVQRYCKTHCYKQGGEFNELKNKYMKIAINKCWGGFGLSPLAVKEYLKLKGKECFFYKTDYKTKMMNRVGLDEATNYDVSLTKDYGAKIKKVWKSFEKDYFYYNDIERNDPDLIKVIEKLGCKEASGQLSSLEVVEIPDDVKWEINDYDGMESVHELHRVW